MLKKLKRRFILTNMLFVCVTVLLLFTVILLFTYRTEREEVERALEQILQETTPNAPRPSDTPSDMPQPEEKPTDTPQFGRGDLPYIYAFTVLIDNEGNILETQSIGAGVEETLLTEAAERAADNDKESGTIPSLELIYRKRVSPDGQRIAFTSLDHVTVTVKNTALVTGGACLAALLIFYLISRLLAGFVIRPTEEAWQRQRQFVADASHDLRTPLTVILANTDLLHAHREETVASQWQWIESTKQEAERMRDLTGSMLELARSETTFEIGTRTQIDASSLAEGVLLQFEPVAFERGVRIESRIAPNIKILGIADAFVRLVHILLDNAIKYTPVGEDISVTLCPVGKTVQLRVCNRGALIPSEALPHIFERFYRVDKARAAGGFGLGLAIAKNLAEAQGGRIAATSSTEEGTAFTVTFHT